MDFTQLRYFHEVARAGTIRKASEKLNVAASALSRQIQLLEHQVGMALFDRSRQGMRLTPAGEIYARYAKLVMRDEEQVRHELSALEGLQQGSVRIISVEGAVSGYLMHAISTFRTRHPGVRFELTVVGTEDVLKAVIARDADLGVAFNGHPDSEIEFRLQISDRLCAVCTPTHPVARKKSLLLADLAHHPVAMPVAGFGIRALIDEACRQSKLVLRPTLLTNSIDGLRSFAANGIGLAILTQLAVRKEVAEGQLAMVPLRDAALRQSSIDVIALKARRQPPAVEAFLTELREVARIRREHILG